MLLRNKIETSLLNLKPLLTVVLHMLKMFFTLEWIKCQTRKNREGSVVLNAFQSTANEPNYYSSKNYVRSFSVFWDEVLTAACLNINKVY